MNSIKQTFFPKNFFNKKVYILWQIGYRFFPVPAKKKLGGGIILNPFFTVNQKLDVQYTSSKFYNDLNDTLIILQKREF